MKFTDRVKNAIGAFSKAENDVSRSLANDFLRNGSRHTPMLQDWSQVEMSDQDMYTGYSYAAISKRANRAATLGKKFLLTEASKPVMEAAKKKEVEVEHPYLKLIRESKEFTEKKFWNDISTYLDLEGVYYLMAVRAISQGKDGSAKVGAVQKFVMMNPYQVKRIRKEADGTIGGYIESKDGMYREIPKEMVIEIRLLNPFDNDEPFSMTDAAKESQFTMKQAGDYTRHSIKGNINAPGAITTDVVLEDQIFDNFVSRIKNHSKGEPLYGNGAGAINWQSMQIDLDKASLDKINEIHRSTLFAVSGTSKTMMGIEESGTGREVSKTQKDDFTENAVMPQVEDIIDALNLDYRKWYPEWEKDRYEIVLDNPLESDRDAELKDIDIRDKEYAMTDRLVQMGYEYEIAARYAHGEINLLELGEPTLEPELTEEEADAIIMRQLGEEEAPVVDETSTEPAPGDPTAVLDPAARMNAVIATNALAPEAPAAPRRYISKEDNEKRLKEAEKRVRERIKARKAAEKAASKQAEVGPDGITAIADEDERMDVAAKYTSIKPLVDGSASIIFKTEVVDQAKMAELLYYYRKEGKLSFVAEDGQEIPVENEEEAQNAIKTHLRVNAIKKATNQLASRDLPDLYEGIDIDMDELGCIMVDTVKIPVTQFVKNFKEEELFEQERYDQGSVVGETKPHVTLLFGLLENGNVWKDKVDMLLEGWQLPTVTIEEVSYFDVGDSYAVIALVERTPELVDGHERLTLLPHVNTFSEYYPHITLAYIKKEADVDKWVKSLNRKYKGQKVATTGLNYGDEPDEKAENSAKGYNPNRDPETGRFTFGGGEEHGEGKAMMTEAEAKEATKNSKFKQAIYHGTETKLAKKIEDEGFKIDKEKNADNNFGTGIYFTDNRAVTKYFAGHGEGGRVFEAYIDTKNPYIEPSFPFWSDEKPPVGTVARKALDYGAKQGYWKEDATFVENTNRGDWKKSVTVVTNELFKTHDALFFGDDGDKIIVVQDTSKIKAFESKPFDNIDTSKIPL